MCSISINIPSIFPISPSLPALSAVWCWRQRTQRPEIWAKLVETHLLWHGKNTLAIWWKRNFHPVFIGLIQRHGLLTDCQFPTFSELGDLVYACVACRQPTASADDYWTAAICFVSKYEDFQKTFNTVPWWKSRSIYDFGRVSDKTVVHWVKLLPSPSHELEGGPGSGRKHSHRPPKALWIASTWNKFSPQERTMVFQDWISSEECSCTGWDEDSPRDWWGLYNIN